MTVRLILLPLRLSQNGVPIILAGSHILKARVYDRLSLQKTPTLPFMPMAH